MQKLDELTVQAPDLWPKACGRSARDIRDAFERVSVGEAKGAAADWIIKLCDLGARDLGSVEALHSADVTSLLLATLVRSWLQGAGLESARASRLARALVAPAQP